MPVKRLADMSLQQGWGGEAGVTALRFGASKGPEQTCTCARGICSWNTLKRLLRVATLTAASRLEKLRGRPMQVSGCLHKRPIGCRHEGPLANKLPIAAVHAQQQRRILLAGAPFNWLFATDLHEADQEPTCSHPGIALQAGVRPTQHSSQHLRAPQGSTPCRQVS